MPKVSVIMPSYNKEKYIAKSIDSILNQTFKDWELIIVDDVSTDNSVEVIKTYTDKRICFFQNEVNIGIAANRNKALELVQGEYVALLDADDIATDFRLKTQVEFLDNHPECDVVYGRYNEIDAEDKVKELYFTALRNPAFVKARMLVHDPIPNGSAMFRKSFIDQYNIRYREGYLGMDDYMFWTECSLHGKIVGLPELFLYWRNTENNGTNTYMYNNNFRTKREKKFAEIQKYALEKNGFVLSEEELNLYFKVFSEYGYKIKEECEIHDLYKLIKKLCSQAIGMENEKEIQMMYKKQFGLAIEKSYIWD